jgi:hypothetical protein
MEARVEKAVLEFRKGRKEPGCGIQEGRGGHQTYGSEAGSEAGGKTGGTGGEVVAYRMESRKAVKDSAAGILYEAGVSEAVRAMVEKYESKH